MNNKKAKQIRKQTKFILVEWLKSLLPEEEASKVFVYNVLQYMPTQKYYVAQRTRYLSSWNPKWVSNKIKKSICFFPSLPIEKIDMEFIKWLDKNKA